MSTTPTWRDLLAATALPEEVRAANKRASALLWEGARAAINEWRPASDPTGEILYAEVREIVGKRRKGTASKIRTVAVGTFTYELDLSEFGSLHAAYTWVSTRNSPTCSCPHCIYHHPLNDKG